LNVTKESKTTETKLVHIGIRILKNYGG